MSLLRRCSLALILIAIGAIHAAAQTALVDPLVVFDAAIDGHEGFPTELTEGLDGMLYGVGYSTTRFASIYRVDPIARTTTIVARLDFGPGWQCGDCGPTLGKLARGPDGRMYGTFVLQSDIDGGAVFSFDPATLTVAHVHDFAVDVNFNAPDGAYPRRVTVGGDGMLYVALGYSGVASGGALTRIDPGSGAIERLYVPPDSFAFYPTSAMVESTPGIWYGAYDMDDSLYCGALYRFNANTGEFTTIKTFISEIDGCAPNGFVRGPDGRIFAAVFGGPPDPAVPGSSGRGAIISIDPATDAVTTLHSFGAGVRGYPVPDVSLGADGMLYTTFQSMNCCDYPFHGDKWIVRIDPNTGAASFIATLPDLGFFEPTGMFPGSDGRFFGVMSGSSIAYAVGVLDAIPVAPALAPLNGTTSISATLKAIGVPLAGRTIAFTLNGSAIGSAITNAQGVATLSGVSVSGIAIGTYAHAIGASFAGDTYFPATSGDGSLTVFDPPTPGLMIGHGFVRDANTKHEFAFIVVELANGANIGGFELTEKTRGKSKDDRFVSLALNGVMFDGDTATFAGTGKWNGISGYRFQAVASDVAGPGNHDTVRVTIYDSANHVVVAIDKEIDGGNVQALRLR